MKKFMLIMMAVLILLLSACAGSKGGNASKVDIPQAQTTSSEVNKVESDEAEAEIDEAEDETETTKKEDSKDDDKKDGKEDKNEDEKEKTTEKKTTSSSGSKTKSSSVVLNGKTIKIGMIATDALMSSVGQALDIQNAPSCHYDGNDTIYVYNGYSIYTYADAGKDKIYLIEINGTNVSTAEGAKVGMSLEKIESIYGKSSSSSASRITYMVSSNTELAFTVAGDKVVLIEYIEK